jgi:Reverse transcriptase (RNA-dependent DNA polymerase)
VFNRVPRKLLPQIWFDDECKAARLTYKAIPKTLPLHQEKYRLFLNICKRKKKAYLREKENRFVSSLSADPRTAWQQFTGRASPTLPSSTALFDTFKKMFEVDVPANPHFVFTPPSLDKIPRAPCPLTFPFSESEVASALSKLKNNKAADMTGMRAEFLKVASDLLVSPLSTLFTRFLHEGFPSSLSNAFIHPIYKKGDPTDPNNYRGISIISVISKLYASCLEKRLTTFLEFGKLRAKGQAGFRRDHRCSDQIFVLNTLREQAQKEKKPLYCCFIDFAKAFDTVPRELLFSRLLSLGIPPLFISAIKSYYSSVSLCVRTTTGYSDFFASNLGVKQGCPLSPTLFGIFIDYFESFLYSKLHSRDVHLLLYADDIALASTSDLSLRYSLTYLSQFADSVSMTVNIEKTKILVFHRKNQKPNFPPFSYKRKHLAEVEEFKYLGFTFHCTQGITYGSSSLCSAAKRAIWQLKTRCITLRIRHVPTLLKLFDSLITPILLYAVEVWFPYTNKSQLDSLPLDIIHRDFLRSILHLPRNINSEVLYAESGSLPLSLKAFKLCANYFSRIVDSDFSSEHLLYKSFTTNRTFEEASWPYLLVSLAMQGLGYAPRIPLHRVATTDRLGSLAAIATSLAQHIQTEAKSRAQSLRPLRESTLNSPRKLYFYSRIWLAEKMPLTYSPFLAQPFSKFSRLLLLFRTSSHQLAIETGAYASKNKERIPRDSRFCLLCQQRNIALVETEDHFVRSCIVLDEIRTQDKFSSLPFDQDVTTLLTSQFFPLNAHLLSQLSDKRSHLISLLDKDKVLEALPGLP